MQKLRIAFVAAALLVMALACALTPFMPSGIGAENRLPAPWPDLWAEGGPNPDYPDQFEAWLKDHVALRGPFISLYSRALRALGSSSQQQVIPGREGWLFFRETLDDYAGVHPLSEDEIARAALVLDTVDAGLRAAGSRLLVAIVPNKATVYPERMNPAYPRADAPGNASRLAAALKAEQVPLSDVLAAHREEGLYFATDTHWNALGARYGARAIITSLNGVLEAGIPLPDPGASRAARMDWPGDLARMLDPYTGAGDAQLYFEDLRPFAYRGRYRSPEDLTIETAGGVAPVRLTVLRDSFSNQLVPELSGAVGEVRYLRAMPLPVRAALDSDAVVLEMVERRLPELLNAPPDMDAPPAEPPVLPAKARTVAMRLAFEPDGDGIRAFGALEAAPAAITSVYLGLRTAAGEAWYAAFPVSGVEGDGNRGFSARLAALPAGAEVRVCMLGDTAVCTDWTPCEAAAPGGEGLVLEQVNEIRRERD